VGRSVPRLHPCEPMGRSGRRHHPSGMRTHRSAPEEEAGRPCESRSAFRPRCHRRATGTRIPAQTCADDGPGCRRRERGGFGADVGKRGRFGADVGKRGRFGADLRARGRFGADLRARGRFGADLRARGRFGADLRVSATTKTGVSGGVRRTRSQAASAESRAARSGHCTLCRTGPTARCASLRRSEVEICVSALRRADSLQERRTGGDPGAGTQNWRGPRRRNAELEGPGARTQNSRSSGPARAGGRHP
jgi:hypothetical protein